MSRPCPACGAAVDMVPASYGLVASICSLECGWAEIHHEQPAGAQDAAPAAPEPRNPDAGSPLEQRFLRLWHEHAPDANEPEREYRAVPGRRFRVDFAWPDVRVGVECEGFDHRKEQRFHGDVDKYNALSSGGWTLYRCTARLLRDSGADFVRMVARCVTAGREG